MGGALGANTRGLINGKALDPATLPPAGVAAIPMWMALPGTINVNEGGTLNVTNPTPPIAANRQVVLLNNPTSTITLTGGATGMASARIDVLDNRGGTIALSDNAILNVNRTLYLESIDFGLGPDDDPGAMRFIPLPGVAPQLSVPVLDVNGGVLRLADTPDNNIDDLFTGLGALLVRIIDSQDDTRPFYELGGMGDHKPENIFQLVSPMDPGFTDNVALGKLFLDTSDFVQLRIPSPGGGGVLAIGLMCLAQRRRRVLPSTDSATQQWQRTNAQQSQRGRFRKAVDQVGLA